MQDIKAVAPRVARALQQWYGADRYARKFGLYSHVDQSLDIHWGNWQAAQARSNLENIATALCRQRNRRQDMGCWWISANAITALIGYMSVTGDHSYMTSVVENTFTKAPGAHRSVAAHGPLSLPFLPPPRPFYTGFINSYYDDEGWWALAWIGAYDLTGDERYLTAATDLFADMAGAWDDHSGGGIYWDKYDGQPDRAGQGEQLPHGWTGGYKNAIANELFIAVAAALGVRHRNRNPAGHDHEEYLQWASRGWKWFSSPRPDGVAMINAASLVNDSPNTDGVNDNTKSIWSYNQGVILSGLCDLIELTGHGAYLGWAEKIASAFIENPRYEVPRSAEGPDPVPPPDASGVINGILHEYNDSTADGGPVPHDAMPRILTAVFKGIFIRNLARLYLATRRASYGQFILANARSALSHMNQEYQFGCNWAAPVDAADFGRQTSGLDLVNAALLVLKINPSCPDPLLAGDAG